MAGKDGDAPKIVDEVADLWFHSMLALARFGLKPADVLAELERREGLVGAGRIRGAQGAGNGRRTAHERRDRHASTEARRSLKTIGHISYALHAIVAVGAVLPGAQAERRCC